VYNNHCELPYEVSLLNLPFCMWVCIMEFCILMNSTNIHAKWFGELAKPHLEHIRFIYPTKKIQYDKYEAGGIKRIPQKKNHCSFNTIYLTYKLLKNNHWI